MLVRFASIVKLPTYRFAFPIGQARFFRLLIQYIKERKVVVNKNFDKIQINFELYFFAVKNLVDNAKQKKYIRFQEDIKP